MKKTEAIQLLGGRITDVAKAVGITSQAVGQWGDELTDAQRDRVQAALFRLQKAKPNKRQTTQTPRA